MQSLRHGAGRHLLSRKPQATSRKATRIFMIPYFRAARLTISTISGAAFSGEPDGNLQDILRVVSHSSP
jgi:hypothetical protein